MSNTAKIVFGKGQYSVMETSLLWMKSGMETLKHDADTKVEIEFLPEAEISLAGVKCLSSLVIEKFGDEASEAVSFKVPHAGWHTDLEEEFVAHEFLFATDAAEKNVDSPRAIDLAYKSGYQTGYQHGYSKGELAGRWMRSPLAWPTITC